MSVKKVLGLFVSLVMVAGFALAQAAASAGPTVKPAAVQKKAGSPAPATATKASGVGSAKVSTANADGDADSFWVEKLDIDGDGNVEDANLVWDDEDKVLFAWKDGTFKCRNGATGSGEVLVAVNAAGNPRNRPAGSGFWIASVDKSECGVQEAGMWGCRFNAGGEETACGVATVDEKNDYLVIAAVSK